MVIYHASALPRALYTKRTHMKVNLPNNESDLNNQLAALKCSVRISVDPIDGLLSLKPADHTRKETIFSCSRSGRVNGLWLGRKALDALGMTNPLEKRGRLATKLQQLTPQGYALMIEGFIKANRMIETFFTRATLEPAKVTDDDILKDLQTLLYLLTPERNEQILSITNCIALSAWNSALEIDCRNGCTT